MAKQTQKKKSSKKKIIIGLACGLLGAAAIGGGLAVGLTKCSTNPVVNKPIVTFSTGGDKDIKIEGPTTVELQPGQTFGDAVSQITKVSKHKDNLDWIFRCWVSKKTFDEDDVPKVLDETVITGPITVYPYFLKPEAEWKEKHVDWEKYDGEDADKEFILPEGETSQIISNFILINNSNEKEELQTGESIKADVKHENIKVNGADAPDGLTIEPIQIASEEGNKSNVNVEFIIHFDGIEISDYYDIPITFTVDFEMVFNGGAAPRSGSSVPNLTFKLTKPWDAPDLTFTPGTELTDLNTDVGNSGIFMDATDTTKAQRYGFLQLSRTLADDERIEVNVVQEEDQPKVNAWCQPMPTQEPDDPQLLNVNISFDKIENIFVEQHSTFTLQFNDIVGDTGRKIDLDFDEEFTLNYTPIDPSTVSPFGVSMESTYIVDDGSVSLPLFAQIQNNKGEYFGKGLYATVTNKTRNNDETSNPIWFTSPTEPRAPFIKWEETEEPHYIPIEGTGKQNTAISAYFQFGEWDDVYDNMHHVGCPMPTQPTTYKTDICFDFYTDPTCKPESKFDSFDLTIDFVYTPAGYWTSSYDTNQWVQYRSLALVATRYDKNTGKPAEYEMGTGWILSKLTVEPDQAEEISDYNYYVASTWDFKDRYERLEKTAKDTNCNFDLQVGSVLGSTKYSADGEKILAVDDTGYKTFGDNEVSNDLCRIKTKYDQGGDAVKWIDSKEFIWDPSSDVKYAPDIALAKIDLGNWLGDYKNPYIWWTTIYPQLKLLRAWTKTEAGTIDVAKGQISNIFEGLPSAFKQKNYSTGFIGGFSSTTVTLPNNKKIKALNWKYAEMKVGLGQVTYIDDWAFDEAAIVGDPWQVSYGTGPLVNVYHSCGAFVPLLQSYTRKSWFDDAGSGAMFVLRKKVQAGTVSIPEVVGINWNGRSHLNYSSTITPFFDCFVDGTTNLFAKYMTPFTPTP